MEAEKQRILHQQKIKELQAKLDALDSNVEKAQDELAAKASF